jgi:ADP-ribose pyrophosphatase YjhB (NUDIX family)
MVAPRIRPIAICAFLHEERILVLEIPLSSGGVGYRPLGGGIEFGEHSLDALKREIKEELGADITLPEFLGVIESIFEHRGEQGHEIVFVYNARFVDPSFYAKQVVEIIEGVNCRAVWKPLSFFITQQAPLFPDGLLALLIR